MAVRLVRESISVTDACGGDNMNLAQTLDHVGIRPYTLASVRRYQRIAARQATPWRTRLIQALWVGFMLLTLVAVATSVVISWVCIAAEIVSVLPWWLYMLFVASLATSMMALYVFAVVLGRVEVAVAEWSRIDYSAFEGPVPAFVQQTVALIRSHCPEARFHIAQLTRNQTVLDPFLIAAEGEDEFYIEVWDEPDFA